MKKIFTFSLCLLALSPFKESQAATVFSTEFTNADGFATRQTEDYIVGTPDFTVTFAGFQQEQGFFEPRAYANGTTQALFAVNGAYNGIAGTLAGTPPIVDNTDIASISFNLSARFVSFTAVDIANGPGALISAFDSSNNLLSQVQVTATNAIQSGALITFDASLLGGAISRIEIDNPGPAGRAPYATSIDGFTAEAIPEPSSSLLAMIGMISLLLNRRKTN